MNKKHFTLIELLVVIGIIAILSAILLPVLSSAAKKADMSKARSEISTLVNAIKQYESVYGVLPVPDGWKNDETYEHKQLGVGGPASADSYRWLIKVLQAETISSTDPDRAFGTLEAANSRRVKFLDFVGNNPGEYKDPWDNDYMVHLDSDYDGEITPDSASPIQGTSAGTFRFSVVVWSKGPDGKADDTANHKTNRDNIYSFPTLWTKADGHNISR